MIRIQTVLITSVVTLAACSHLPPVAEQQITINTDPQGMKVQFSDGQSCMSPCTVRPRMEHPLQITVTEEKKTPPVQMMLPPMIQ